MKRPVEDGVSLLIGATLGAAAMYLLDPDQGVSRRKDVKKTTRAAVEAAGESASHGLESVRDATARLLEHAQHLVSTAQDGAKNAASSGSEGVHQIGTNAMTGVDALTARAAAAAKEIYERLHSQVSEAGDHASGLKDRAGKSASRKQQQVASGFSNLRDQLSDKFSDLKGNTRDRYGKWLNRTSLAMGRDEDHHYVGQTACALGSLAIGAGLIYFLDPSHGESRRSAVVEKSTHILGETGDMFRRVGRYVAKPGKQLVQRAKEQFSQPTESHGDSQTSQLTPETAYPPAPETPLDPTTARAVAGLDL